MSTDIKIMLYPEEHKSKNGPFFEDLMAKIFDRQGYEIERNINFTGLEIDIYAKHKIRNERVVVECKAKKKPLSTEVKNFGFNILFKDQFKYGYFLYTEDLDHQAAALKNELLESEKTKERISFIGPSLIIDLLADIKLISKFDVNLVEDQSFVLHKITLAYTYFGVFYLVRFGEGTVAKYYSLLKANDLSQIININVPVDESHSLLTYEQTFKTEFDDLSDLSYRVLSKSEALQNLMAGDGVLSHVKIKESFLGQLLNMGTSFAHSHKDEISLDDLFVWPNVKKITSIDFRKRTKSEIFSLFDIYNTTSEDGIRYVLLGDENSGKTSVLKYLHYSLYQHGYIPVFINSATIKNIRQNEIIKFLTDNMKRQYSNAQNIIQYDKKKVIILLDDFHKMNIKSEFKVVFMKNLSELFDNIIAVGNTMMPLEVLAKNKTSKNVFDKFDIYTILEFGPSLRHELVDKWNKLGQDPAYMDINELYRKNDFTQSQINSILGKNYIPSFPFYLLTILQALENTNVQNPSYSLHGFYYELLINDSLSKSIADKKEISLYYNYITQFCYFLFDSKVESVSISDFEEFHVNYCIKHDLNYNFQKIMLTLKSANMLEINGSVRVLYKYVYYFFIAKHLTNNMHDKEVKDLISKMCKRVYRDEYANIIMFLTHLSKDKFIIDELLNNSRTIFKENKISKLEGDIENINSLIQELPKQILDVIDSQDVRKEELAEKDEIEELEKDYDSVKNEEYDIDENINSADILSKLTLSLKTIEILGQVAKKYWGEMTGDTKHQIVAETYYLGLRTLDFVLGLVSENKSMIIS